MKQPNTLPAERESLPRRSKGPIDTITLDLLAKWQLEDATEDTNAIRAAEEELAEFKRAMNEARSAAGEPLLYP